MASSEATMPPANDDPASQVSIRVIALAHSTNENEDIYLTLHLDTTVAQLKCRLQERLSRQPRPESQRLIYQGRPLVEGSSTLRQILRLDPSNTSSPISHVIHVVVRDDQSTFDPNSSRPNSRQAHGRPQPQPPPSLQPQPQPQLQTSPQSEPQYIQEFRDPAPPAPPLLPHQPFALPPNPVPEGHPAHQMLQDTIRQTMAIHNQFINRFPNGVHAAVPMPTGNPQHVPQMPHLPHMPQFQFNTNHPPRPNMPHSNMYAQVPTAGIRSNAPTANAATPNGPPNVFQTRMSLRVEGGIGPNGERVQRVVQSTPSFPVQTNPVERSASAPGGPNASVPNMQVQTDTIRPAVTSGFPQLQPQHLTSFQQPFGAQPMMPMGIAQSAVSNQLRQPVAFLVSSPSGPEALLFAPNHGYFSSQQTLTTTQSTNQLQPRTVEPTDDTQQPTPTQPIQPNRTAARDENQAQVAIRPQVVVPGQAQGQARREGEDLIALALQRGWLFLRLYMFIFVLSEPGTWRRYILLTIASLVCLLPRNNPFTDLFQVVRRHFDNLIGPPQPPDQTQRQQAHEQTRAQNHNEAEASAPNNSGTRSAQQNRRAQIPTPEEHARRLLRDHEQQHPNVIRDTIYRIEQAAALFLASLIPGVGERHVRAREEARRIVQDEEDRRRREEEEQAQQEVSNDNEKQEGDSTALPSVSASPAGSDSKAVSTGVDTPGSSSASAPTSSDGPRLRTGGTIESSSSSS